MRVSTPSIVDVLLSHHFHFVHETELQEGIWTVFADAGFDARREVSLNTTDRIDFMVGAIGIEVKVDGSLSAIIRQSMRYVKCPEVGELLVVSSLARHLRMPETLGGKPVTVCHLGSGAF